MVDEASDDKSMPAKLWEDIQLLGVPNTRFEGPRALNRAARDTWGPPRAADEHCPHPADLIRLIGAYLLAATDPDVHAAIIDQAERVRRAESADEIARLRRSVPTRLITAGDRALQEDAGIKRMRGRCDGCRAIRRELFVDLRSLNTSSPEGADSPEASQPPIRLCRDCRERQDRALRPHLDSRRPPAGSTVESSALADLTLRQLIGHLPDRQRTAVTLDYLGWTKPEIARHLQVTTQTVHSYLDRAHNHFRATVDRDDLAA